MVSKNRQSVCVLFLKRKLVVVSRWPGLSTSGPGLGYCRVREPKMTAVATHDSSVRQLQSTRPLSRCIRHTAPAAAECLCVLCHERTVSHSAYTITRHSRSQVVSMSSARGSDATPEIVRPRRRRRSCCCCGCTPVLSHRAAHADIIYFFHT